MKSELEFLASPPRLDETSQSADNPPRKISRRSFVKRSGGATVAAMIGWNITQTAHAENDSFIDPSSWIVVTQEANYPGASNTTDLGVSYIRSLITGASQESPYPFSRYDGIAYINGIPEMPSLNASLVQPKPGSSATWSMKIRSERTERGVKDDFTSPAVTMPATSSWHLLGVLNGKFIGGIATVYCSYINTNNRTNKVKTSFFIRGKNPLDATAKAYINAKSSAIYNGRFWFAWAMAQHESRGSENNRVFSQFNASGELKELPNLGPPDGWGIAQLDKPLGVSASTNEVYNWKFNIDKFFSELVEKEGAQKLVFAAYASTYPAAPLPPNYTPPGCATPLTALEAGTIQLYNSGAKLLYIRNGKIVPLGSQAEAIRSAWTYTTINGWQFHANLNNYVRKVIYDEFEANSLVVE